MNIFTRIWVAFYAICFTVISVFFMVFALSPALYDRMSTYVKDEILVNKYFSFAVFILAFFVFVISVIFLTTGIRNRKEKRAVAKRTGIGEIRISLDTLENLALTAVKRFNGVKDTKAGIFRNKKEDNVNVALKISVMPEINLPSLSEDIQRKVKKLIEENAGVGVKEVKVTIDNIYTGFRAKVE